VDFAVRYAAVRTVDGWLRRWTGLGQFERMVHELLRLRRREAGRRPQPRLAIIDTQTVKCLSVRGPRGYDAAKRAVGRKRVAMVDADGNWLAVGLVPASVQERGTLPALGKGKVAWPSLRAAIPDGAFTAEHCHAWSNLHGMRHEVVSRAGQKGFAVLPWRWVVERSFGWLTQ
jgi:putative transposase